MSSFTTPHRIIDREGNRGVIYQPGDEVPFDEAVRLGLVADADGMDDFVPGTSERYDEDADD